MKKTRGSLIWILVLTLALSGMPAGTLAEELTGNGGPEVAEELPGNADAAVAAESGLAMEEPEDHFPEETTAEAVLPAAEETDDTTSAAVREQIPETEELEAVQAGYSITWEGTGKLKVSGSGALREDIEDYVDIDSIESLTIVGFSEIGERAFQYCTNIRKVVIPKTVTKIGGWAFSGCEGITSVVYGGTAGDWDKIQIGKGNLLLTRKLGYDYQTVSLGKNKVTLNKMCYFEPPADGYYYVLISGSRGDETVDNIHPYHNLFELCGEHWSVWFEENGARGRFADMWAGSLYEIPVYSAASGTCYVTIERAATKLSSIENTASGIRISWEPAKAAGSVKEWFTDLSYRVYRKNSAGKWTAIGNTRGTSYTDTNVTAGGSYTYTVRAIVPMEQYNGSFGDYDKTGLTAVRLPNMKPTLVNAANGVKVSWTKAAGAKGYYVYRKSGSGSYARIADVTGGSTVSYTDTAVNTKSGTTYTYAVRAYNGTSRSSYTGTAILRLGTIKPALGNTSAGILVKWTQVTGAKGYYVYRKVGSGSYARIATITDGSTVSYTDTDTALVNGGAYSYAVRAFNGNTAGYYTGAAIYRLKGVAISSLTNTSGLKMVVKWPADSKVTGYLVQVSTTGDFSSGNQAVTVTKNTTVSTTISSLTKGKTYYVRVRTYKQNSAGTKYYSGWSAKKSVKIAK